MKKTKAIAVLLAVIMVSSMLAAFAISPACSDDTGGEVGTNYAPTITYLNELDSTYTTYLGYNNDTKHRYTWVGDTIKLKVRVTDDNGVVDIDSVELYIEDILRSSTVVQTPISDTSADYTLTYTVPAKTTLDGDKAIKVKVTDKNETPASANTGTDISNVYFNPSAWIQINGDVDYEMGDPGEIVQADDTIINSSSDCGSEIYGINRVFEIDETGEVDDESSSYNWSMRVRNPSEGNVFLELKVSGTDMTGAKGGTILITNQYLWMNSTSNSMKQLSLASTKQILDPSMTPNEHNYFDFYLKYPAVPKDTYSGEITFDAPLAMI